MFGVSFLNRSYANIIKLPLDYIVERYSWGAIGGPKNASILAFGNIHTLNKLSGYLRYSVNIISPHKGVVWYGYIDAVDIYSSDFQSSTNLSNMWNSVHVQYTDGNGVSTLTAAGTVARSVSEYGTKELVISAADIDTSAAAVDLRDRYLDYYGLPRAERLPVRGGQTYAMLTCSGWFNTLDWKYYADTGTSSVATTTQISDIVTQDGQFLTGSNIRDASGINTIETRDGTQRAGSEILKLLSVGTSTDDRLLAKINNDRRLEVYKADANNVKNYRVSRGIIYNNTGYKIPAYRCPVGVWVTTTSGVIGNSSVTLSDPGSFFVEEAEYEVSTDTWTPIPRGSYVPGGLGL